MNNTIKTILLLLFATVLYCVGTVSVLAQQPFFFPIPLGAIGQSGTIAMDASGSTSQSSGSNVTAFSTPTYTTTSSNDVLILDVLCAQSGSPGTTPPTVSSVTGGGLTWLQRKTFVNSGDSSRLDIWYAQASGIFSAAVTAHFSSACLTPTLILFGVVNVNASTPWDSNVSLPATTTNTGTSPRTITGVSTTSPTTMMLWFIGSSDANYLSASPAITGWAGLSATLNTGGCCLGSSWAADRKVTSAQSAITISQTDTAGSVRYAIIVDALVSQ